jgi:hypothetical protein
MPRSPGNGMCPAALICPPLDRVSWRFSAPGRTNRAIRFALDVTRRRAPQYDRPQSVQYHVRQYSLPQPATALPEPKTTNPAIVPIAVFATRPAMLRWSNKAHNNRPDRNSAFHHVPTISPAGACKPGKFTFVSATRALSSSGPNVPAPP